MSPRNKTGYDYPRLLVNAIKEFGQIDWIAEITGRRSSGVLDACHVIPKDTLCQAFPFGAVWNPHRSQWLPLGRDEDPKNMRTKTLGAILMDLGNIVLGSRDLHNAWDLHQLAIPRGELPRRVEKFAVEHGLVWWLTDYYEGRRVA